MCVVFVDMTGQWVMDETLSFYYAEESRSCSPQAHNFRVEPQLGSYGWSFDENAAETSDGISWESSHPAAATTSRPSKNLDPSHDNAPPMAPSASRHNLDGDYARQSSFHMPDPDSFYGHDFQLHEQHGLGTSDFGCDDLLLIGCQDQDLDDFSDSYQAKASSLSPDDPWVSSIDQTFTQPLSLWECSMGFNMRLPISGMDKYVVALRQIVRRCAEATPLNALLCRTLSAEGVLWIVRESWPTAERFWNLTTCTQGFLHAELWRNFPCKDSYQRLPAAYRPTQMQLLVPHSPIIDWLPWPDLRDMIILYQDQIDIDALCRYAILTMVAHRRKRTRAHEVGASSRTASASTHMLDQDAQQEDAEVVEGPGVMSFRIWDLTRLETLDGPTRLVADQSLIVAPRPRSPSMKALQGAFDLVYDDFSTQKLEHRFFERYPFLYCQRLVSEFKIQDLTTVPFEDVGLPLDMTRDTVFRLKETVERIIGGVTLEL